MGKGKNPQAEAQEHRSRPLASLKDPSAFGPPPKNLNYNGAAAVPNAITPDHSGLGAPLNVEELRAKEEEEQREIRAAEKDAATPPMPYRADTTVLSTSNLPKPPVRRIEQEDQRAGGPANQIPKPKPSLPPRLPPRPDRANFQNSFSEPPPYTANTIKDAPVSSLNQGALRRLGSAGINVPGLGVGGSSNVTSTEKPIDGNIESSPTTGHRPQLNELQSRFSKISSKSSQPPSPSGSLNQGTTFAQKKAALKTASSFRNDPSSVSLSDAGAAASTANNFRERHGDQVASGWKNANALNQKYDLSNRVGAFPSSNSASTTNQSGSVQNEPASSTTTETPDFGALAVRKKPPPPPPKKPFLGGDSAFSPPPVPLSSKPKQ